MKVVRRKLNESTNNNIVKLWMVTVFEMLQEMSNGQDISVYEDELVKHLENEYPADFYVECVGEEIAIYDQSNDGVIYCTPNAVEVEGKLYYELLNDVKYLKTLYRKYNTSVKDNFMSKLYSMLDNRNMRESVKFTRKNKKMNEGAYARDLHRRFLPYLVLAFGYLRESFKNGYDIDIPDEYSHGIDFSNFKFNFNECKEAQRFYEDFVVQNMVI